MMKFQNICHSVNFPIKLKKIIAQIGCVILKKVLKVKYYEHHHIFVIIN